ncbi:MAG: peptidoglycan recognition protein family protein [Fimbriimonadaceae bacterium]|nr:peptidoglycan recognition protein family protein [Fimbriimonadaceae bacterium]
MAIPFVGRRFTPEAFRLHLRQAHLASPGWNPVGVTLHHTANPSLSMRPAGFTQAHLQNLRHYYENTLGWSGAPHLFVDDREDGIIVFQRLDRRGVHAVEFNSRFLGIEVLGDYDREDPRSGRGLACWHNAAQAAEALLDRIGTNRWNFHRDDKSTRKTCPGRLVSKSWVEGLILEARRPEPTPRTSPGWRIKIMSGQMGGEEWPGPVILEGGRNLVRRKDVAAVFGWPAILGLTVVQVDSSGAGWVSLADAARGRARIAVDAEARSVVLTKGHAKPLS